MDQTISREQDLEYDIESGGNISEEDESRDPDSSEKLGKNLFSWAWSRLPNFDGSEKHETGVETCSNSLNSADVMDDNVPLFVDVCLEDGQKKLPHVKNHNGREKNNKTNSKPPKPPRPPKGPLLDAADKKLVQEITEIAMRKRERIKKMKAIRKMKARKASSSSSSSSSSSPSCAGLSAMVITFFFFAFIIIQVIYSGRNTTTGIMASPEPSVAADEGLISVHFSKNFAPEVGQGK